MGFFKQDTKTTTPETTQEIAPFSADANVSPFTQLPPQLLQQSVSNISNLTTPQVPQVPQVPQATQVPQDNRQSLINQLQSIKQSLDTLKNSRIRTDFNPNFDRPSFSSNSLVKNSTKASIFKKRKDLEKSLLEKTQPSEKEQALLEQFTDISERLAREQNKFDRQFSNIEFNQDTQGNTLGLFGSGQQVRAGQLSREQALQIGALRNLQDAARTSLQVAQNLRGASLSDLKALQSLTTPEILGTPKVDNSTGKVTAFQRDPLTGDVTTVDVGNIPVDKTFKIQSIITNEATGEKFAVGVRQGETEPSVLPLSGTRGGKPRIGTSSSVVTSDKPLSTNQIVQFKKTYGWTPPFGFSASELIDYMNDNPGATPEELEAGANAISTDTTTNTTTSTTTDTPIDTTVSSAKEFTDTILTEINDDQIRSLKKKADSAGVSSFFKTKRVDVKNFLNTPEIQKIIQDAIDAGATKGEILTALTE